MNNNIKIALALITGGTLIYLSRKIKNRENKSKTFIGEDGNKYRENEMYFTANGKVYKNGKQLHFKTPEGNDEVVSKSNFIYEETPQGYNSQLKSVKYHQKGVRHH